MAVGDEARGDRVRAHFGEVGDTDAEGIRRLLGVSQPTVSRLLRQMPEVVPYGPPRLRRYAMARSIRGVDTPLPLYEVLEDGRARRLGQLRGTRPEGYLFESALDGVRSKRYEDLPWFLQDARPAGFLGRMVPRRHPELGLPGDIGVWSGDDCLRYLTRFGSDVAGNLVIGDDAFALRMAQLQAPPDGVEPAERGLSYAAFAADVLATGAPGSSAAGEQPKFVATLAPSQRVIVKFSPPLGQGRVAQRTADLLVAEHLALASLRDAGEAAAETAIIEAGGRVFLESTRFDRRGLAGRLGQVTLGVLDDEFGGDTRGWGASASALASKGILPGEVVRPVRLLELFGKLIANSDMHRANLSFFRLGLEVVGLSPAYDMTPMAFAARGGEVVDRPVEDLFEPPAPAPADADIWPAAWAAALAFWGALAAETRVSEEMRAIAERCRARVEALEPLIALLPD